MMICKVNCLPNLDAASLKVNEPGNPTPKIQEGQGSRLAELLL
jgi:hypothetical protein